MIIFIYYLFKLLIYKKINNLIIVKERNDEWHDEWHDEWSAAI